jgi:hypothetical protein
MSLLDAVNDTGVIPDDKAKQHIKKRFSEQLSSHLAVEVGEGLTAQGFPNVKPVRNGAGEKAFQGGLGPKRVDVSFADEQNGLLLAVSIKTISFSPFSKNLKNRFADLCTEAITLHMRFPYAVVCALFAFPITANQDVTPNRKVSTFQRAMNLFRTIDGRREYTDPGEKFENVTMMLYQPNKDDSSQAVHVTLFDAHTGNELTEEEYFQDIRRLYNQRNPHAAIGEEI